MNWTRKDFLKRAGAALGLAAAAPQVVEGLDLSSDQEAISLEGLLEARDIIKSSGGYLGGPYFAQGHSRWWGEPVALQIQGLGPSPPEWLAVWESGPMDVLPGCVSQRGLVKPTTLLTTAGSDSPLTFTADFILYPPSPALRWVGLWGQWP